MIDAGLTASAAVVSARPASLPPAAGSGKGRRKSLEVWHLPHLTSKVHKITALPAIMKMFGHSFTNFPFGVHVRPKLTMNMGSCTPCDDQKDFPFGPGGRAKGASFGLRKPLEPREREPGHPRNDNKGLLGAIGYRGY